MFQSEWREVDVPQDWAVTEDDACVTLTCSQGGTVQISASRKAVGMISPDEVLEFIHENGKRTVTELRFETNHFNGYSGEGDFGNALCREWWFYKGALLVFVTALTQDKTRHPFERDLAFLLSSLRPRN